LLAGLVTSVLWNIVDARTNGNANLPSKDTVPKDDEDGNSSGEITPVQKT
jgi:hypothetical protein